MRIARFAVAKDGDEERMLLCLGDVLDKRAGLRLTAPHSKLSNPLAD